MAAHELSQYEEGVIVGLLVTQGSFGGDGRQPQVTLRMHVRHEALLRWLADRVERSKLYGPYEHGDRRYFQWMARGRALTDGLLPILEARMVPELDSHAYGRLRVMCDRYAEVIARSRPTAHGEAGPRP